MSFPFQFMMRGMLDAAMRSSSQQAEREQQQQFPKKLKCPVCNVEHEYKPASEAVVRVEDRCTHDARTIFCAAPCPVCLEESTGPPMVALACGHLICPNDFKGMGGKMGQEAMLSSEEAAERDRNEAEENRNNDDNEEDEMEDDEAQLFHMIMAMAAMREQGIEPPPELMMPFMRVARNMMGDDDDDDDDEDEDYFDEDEYDEDDESDYDDMPPLLDANGNVQMDEQQQQEEEESDDSMPPLLDAQGNTVQEQARPDNGRRTTSRQDEDDDSDFDDMPPLVSIGGQQAGGNDANAQQKSGSGKNDNSSQSRQAASNRCNDNGTGTVNGTQDEDDDSDFDDMPPLVSIGGQQQAGSNDSSNTRSGAGNDTNAQQNSGSGKKNNSSQGRQASNRRTGKGSGAKNGSGDNSDDDSVPDLSIRGGGHDIRGSDDDDDDDSMPDLSIRGGGHDIRSSDDDSVPALINRHNDSVNSSDQDSDSDENSLPDLVVQQRGAYSSDEDSSSSDSDNFAAGDASNDSDDDSGIPVVFRNSATNVRTRRPRYNVDSSSESDDSSVMPALLDPESVTSDEEEDKDVPELTVRPEIPFEQNKWDGMPPFNEQMNENIDNERLNENTRDDDQSTAPAAATSASKVPHAERLKEATNTAKNMKPRLLKSKLNEMGVSTDHILEKSELVDAYVKAVVPVDTTDEEAAEASSGPPQPKPATPDRPAPKPKPPVDPFADLPSLVPARDPPKDGCWVLSVKDNTWMELQYAFMEDSEVKCRSYGKKFRKGARLLNATNGSIWVYAPPPDEDGGKWEIHQVKEVDLQIKMYDFQEKADAVTDGRDCLWALCPADSTNTESERNLVCVNSRNPLGKQLRDHIPFSSQLIMNRSGGVWLNVGRGGTSNATMQAGLYHVSPEGSTKRVLDEVDDSSYITFDIDRTGLWVFAPSGEDGKAVLTHIDDTGETKEQSLDVDFKRVEAVVDGCDESVYLHYKVGNRWKLCQATLGKTTVKEVSDCARNSDITSDGNGGCWTWKKSGRRGSERTLAHVDSDGNYHEYSRRFRAGSFISSA